MRQTPNIQVYSFLNPNTRLKSPPKSQIIGKISKKGIIFRNDTFLWNKLKFI